MIATNVLCLKKKKKKRKTYISNLPDTLPTQHDPVKGTKSGSMLHITEDTPVDMLSGAMDLTIHLPSGKAVKTCVERSTPMMDLLVHVTTKHQLQITNHTLQPLQTAPNASYSETVLNYYPNTPIGTLDTQHVRVVPKTRSLPVPKNVSPGHQPFESTFRLKVYLPRNQLYVTRVSRHVQLEEIMRKVCEEKNLDSSKYEVRHPGNLEEVLDPKLTLNDYMITEIYLVQKGLKNLTQTITSNDIMTLRKEEERKQMHNKTGGGVFNLIFRRGKSNTGSGSNSKTENSINSTHIEDSKRLELTVAALGIVPPPKQETQQEKPRPPQRKRRPAPKPPQRIETPLKEVENIRDSPVVPDVNTNGIGSKNDTGITICHSRHSSDSSGYHETSILSDNCNTSLTRRSRLQEGDTAGPVLSRRSESTGNLTKMTIQSRSTSSLAYPGRKKKTAAPPPPVPLQIPKISNENPSPVDASQTPSSSSSQRTDLTLAPPGSLSFNVPPYVARRRKGPMPTPRPKSAIPALRLDSTNEILETDASIDSKTPEKLIRWPYNEEKKLDDKVSDNITSCTSISTTDILKSLEYLNFDDQGNEIKPPEIIAALPKTTKSESYIQNINILQPRVFILNSSDIDDSENGKSSGSLKSNEYVLSDSCALTVKNEEDQINLGKNIESKSFQNHSENSVTHVPITKEEGSSPYEINRDEFKYDGYEIELKENKEEETFLSAEPDYRYINVEDSISEKLDADITDEVVKDVWRKCSPQTDVYMTAENYVVEVRNIADSHAEEEAVDSGSLMNLLDGNNVDTEPILPDGLPHTTAKQLDLILENSSQSSTNHGQIDQEEEVISMDEKTSVHDDMVKEDDLLDEVDRYISCETSPQDSGNSSDISEKSKLEEELCPEEISDIKQSYDNEIENWQLPSPPKAFKDCTPNEKNKLDCVLSSELYEKLKKIEESENSKDAENSNPNCDYNNTESDDTIILNKLSLENLEKRKTLVYNRELSTSFRPYDHEVQKEKMKKFSSDVDLSVRNNQFNQTVENMQKNSSGDSQPRSIIQKSLTTSTLPNFKITTYNEPKQNIKVFEDDTIRSNTESTRKSSTLDRTQAPFGRSMENLSTEQYKSEEPEYTIHNPRYYYSRKTVNRTGSFSTDKNDWTPSKPVARSKSHVAIREDAISNKMQPSNILKSNSLFDVSGLTSLEVMRKIQSKLNEPSVPIETPKEDRFEIKEDRFEMKEDRFEMKEDRCEKKEDRFEMKEEKSQSEELKTVPIRKFQYSGPPSVNMGTWSERPKVPVSVKADSDYKFGQGTNTGVNGQIRAGIQNIASEKNKVEMRNSNFNNLHYALDKTESEHVTIKINGFEPINGQKNNILIQIGDRSSKFHEFNTENRSTFSCRNKNAPRPHSIAFPSDFDLSRVPVVRSVELKKSYQDIGKNTSITHLNKPNGNYHSSELSSHENHSTGNYIRENSAKSILRTKSFLHANPTVVGFRNFPTVSSDTHSNNLRKTISISPMKQIYETNRAVPFSKSNLRRTESKKIVEDYQNQNISHVQIFNTDDKNKYIPDDIKNNLETKSVVPTPPQMPKVVPKTISKRQFVPVLDPRDELLKSIRDFGGKKGLRSRKA